MKNFELGDKVIVERYYKRNGIKPHINTKDKSRYGLLDWGGNGIYCGKRNIHTKGHTEYIDYAEGYGYVPATIETVHLVAVSKKQLLYVPDEFIKREV